MRPLRLLQRAGAAVTRVVSGAVLIAIAVGVVWFAPSPVFFAVAEILLALAFVEYTRLAEAGGLPIPVVPAGVATIVASVSVAYAVEAALMAGLGMLAAGTPTMWGGGRGGPGRAAAAGFSVRCFGPPVRARVAPPDPPGRVRRFLLLV